MTLEALAEIYKVYLLVIPIIDTPLIWQPPREMLGLCARFTEWLVKGHEDPAWRNAAGAADGERRLAAAASSSRTRPGRFVSLEAVRGASRVFADVSFHAVHVFRLDMVPFAEPFLDLAGHRPFCVLDLDDIQSETRRRIAALFANHGDRLNEAFERLELAKYFRMEREWLPRFNELWVCSDRDRYKLSAQYGCRNVAVIPNAVRLPKTRLAIKGEGLFTLFFVGSMGYFPNRDAALYLCSETAPRLRQLADRPFRVLIAGRDSLTLREAVEEPKVVVLGPVSDLERYYGEADMVAVPLGAGGGTRIKVLESFSYGRPVVSISIGAEGLSVRDSLEILLADAPDDFARRCTWIMKNAEEAAAITARAYNCVRANHSLETVKTQLKRRRDFRTGDLRAEDSGW